MCCHAIRRMGMQSHFCLAPLPPFPFRDTLPVCSSLVQMLLGDLLGLPKWLQLLKMEYIFFLPLSACPFFLPGLGEKGKVSDPHLSLTCRHKFIISLQKGLWLCLQLVPSPSFSASSRKSCCSLRTSETKRRSVMSCRNRAWEQQCFSPWGEKYWPTNTTTAHGLTRNLSPNQPQSIQFYHHISDVKLTLEVRTLIQISINN